MGRPKEHGEDVAQRVLRAAVELLDDHGPDAVSVRAVADAAETSVRAVYSTHGDKDGLMQAIAAYCFDELSLRIETSPHTDDPLHDLVGEGLERYRRYCLEHPHRFRLMFQRRQSDVADLTPTNRAASMRAFAGLIAGLQRCQDAGYFRGIDLASMALGLNAAANGLIHYELLGQLEAFGGDVLWRDLNDALLLGWQARADGQTIVGSDP